MSWENLKINFPDDGDKATRRSEATENSAVDKENLEAEVEKTAEKTDPWEEDRDEEWQRQEADRIFAEDVANRERFEADLATRGQRLKNEKIKKLRQTPAGRKPAPAPKKAKQKDSATRSSKSWEEIMAEVYSGDKDVMGDIDPSRNMDTFRNKDKKDKE